MTDATSTLALPVGVTASQQAAWLLTGPARLLFALAGLLMVLVGVQVGAYQPRHAAPGRYAIRSRHAGRHLTGGGSATRRLAVGGGGR